MATQREIAKEHGMSFESVVRSYAEAGHSMTDTAMIISYSYPAFIRLCERQGWREWFVTGQQSIGAQQARESRVGACTPAARAAIDKACANNPRYHWVEHDGITDTLTGHARRLGLPYRTVRNRWAAHPGDVAHALSLESHRKPPSHEARAVLRKSISAGYRR